MDSHADKIRRPLDSKPVSPTMFAHFVLRTANRAPLRDWYLKVLNARQVFENEYISFITYDDEHHRVAFIQIPGLKIAPDDSWGRSPRIRSACCSTPTRCLPITRRVSRKRNCCAGPKLCGGHHGPAQPHHHPGP